MSSKIRPSSDHPTLGAIAARLGVSVMSVSRALRGAPKVGEALRKRILRAAEEAGYRPDPTAARLMRHLRERKKGGIVASIAGVTSLHEGEEPPYFSGLREAARERARALGYRLELFRVAGQGRFDASLQRTLTGRGIEGVVLLQMRDDGPADALLDWTRFAVVAASPSVGGADFPRVEIDVFHNACLMCERIVERGKKRIGFVGSRVFSERSGRAFEMGAAWRSVAAGGAAVAPLIFDDVAEVERRAEDWLRHERPDAIIAYATACVPALRGAIRRAKRKNVLLTCNNVDPAAPCCPGLDERHALMGATAVDLLAGMLARFEKGRSSRGVVSRVQGEWVEAETKA